MRKKKCIKAEANGPVGKVKLFKMTELGQNASVIVRPENLLLPVAF